MNTQTAAAIFFSIFFLQISIPPVSAQVISSYEEMFTLLPGGQKKIHINRPVIDEAHKWVAERQMLSRQRSITFIKPIGFDRLNEKYISIAFEALILPRKKAIFAMLFETNGEHGIVFSNPIYLAWVGSRDTKNYENMTPDAIRKSYQELGVADCTPGFVRTGVEKALLGKAEIGHTHDASSIVYGLLSESVIPDSIARNTDIGQIVNPAIAKLENKILKLERTVEALSLLLEGVSRKDGTLVFSDVNVQIVNGKGATNKINGRGNLIVGYNEARGADSREGSHNIVVGSKNAYGSYGGMVTGFNNEIGGKYASVIGGNNNSATGDYASITGGENNNAKGKYSCINGQSDRTKVDADANPHFQ